MNPIFMSLPKSQLTGFDIHVTGNHFLTLFVWKPYHGIFS